MECALRDSKAGSARYAIHSVSLKSLICRFDNVLRGAVCACSRPEKQLLCSMHCFRWFHFNMC